MERGATDGREGEFVADCDRCTLNKGTTHSACFHAEIAVQTEPVVK